MIDDLKTAHDKVAWLLDEFPETRDNDKLLWLGYLVAFRDLKQVLGGEENYRLFKNMLLSPRTCSMESVRRVRQKLQEQGKYLGTKRRPKLDESERVRQWTREN